MAGRLTPGAEASPLLEMRNIVKTFPGVRALDGVSFTLHSGEIHAIVGENGAGKSTLMKILGGVYRAGTYDGEIILDGAPVSFDSSKESETAGIAIIHQELALVPEMTAAENIYLGAEPGRFGLFDRSAVSSGAREALRRLGLDIDLEAPVKSLSVGQQQLVEIARAFRKNSRIIVFDEPTASLTGTEVDHLLELTRSLAARGTAVVYISHKLEEVFSLADRITVLRDGATVDSRPGAAWTRKALITAMVGRSMSDFYPASRPARTATERLDVSHLSVEHPTRAGALLLDDVSFAAYGGETLCLAGLMGAGRSELLLTLFGSPPGRVLGGSLAVDGRPVHILTPSAAIGAGLALVPEDRKHQGLILHLTVAGNLGLAHLDRFTRFGIVDNDALHGFARETAKRLDIRLSSLDVETETLSGGNQQKVVLGKWLARTPAVLFLDEPTRGIDVGAKVEIYHFINQLKEQGIAVVAVSSDLPEVIGIADRVLVMRRGRLAGELKGDAITQERIMELAT